MTTCIVGSNGNMGRRYATILREMGQNFIGIDVCHSLPAVDNYIIATPTDTHIDIIKTCKGLNMEANILCEKPITKKIKDFERIPKEYWDDIFMVNQYQYYPNIQTLAVDNGLTEYNFYHSGGDGLAWDCIQLIHLAKNKKRIRLSNKSPVWKASINGMELSKGLIDQCYLDMLEDFYTGSFQLLWDLNKAYNAHEEVWELLGGTP